MDIHTVSSFVSKNIISTKEGRKCVDGRYEDDEYSGMIARAGADFGYVMAMLGYNLEQKLNLSVEQCVDIVYKSIIDLEGTFYMHTDTHADPTIPYSIGCGHASKAMSQEYALTFGLDPEQVQKALLLLKDSPERPVTLVTLQGDHAEEGVLIIKNEDYTVNSKDDEHMYFIYDKKRDDLFLKDLVEKIGMDQLVYENFQRVSTLQLGATLQALAKGLPIFEVTIDEEHDIQVTNTGTV